MTCSNSFEYLLLSLHVLIDLFIAQVTLKYAREMVAAIMGLEQLVRQYAMGHAPPVLARAAGAMVNIAFIMNVSLPLL